MHDRSRDRTFAWKLVALMGALLIAGVLLTSFVEPTSSEESDRAAASATTTMVARPSFDGGVLRAIDVSKLPRLCQGTIVINGQSRRLFIDGEPTAGVSATVVAGRHSVGIGSMQNVHVVDVPCDAAVAIR